MPKGGSKTEMVTAFVVREDDLLFKGTREEFAKLLDLQKIQKEFSATPAELRMGLGLVDTFKKGGGKVKEPPAEAPKKRKWTRRDPSAKKKPGRKAAKSATEKAPKKRKYTRRKKDAAAPAES